MTEVGAVASPGWHRRLTTPPPWTHGVSLVLLPLQGLERPPRFAHSQFPPTSPTPMPLKSKKLSPGPSTLGSVPPAAVCLWPVMLCELAWTVP